MKAYPARRDITPESDENPLISKKDKKKHLKTYWKIEKSVEIKKQRIRSGLALTIVDQKKEIQKIYSELLKSEN